MVGPTRRRQNDAGAEKTVLGACPHDCPDTCSMLVTVKNDRVVKVVGNPKQPFTDGRLCVKVNHYEERVHSPDRILYPMRRAGPKGSGKFERIGWDAALTEIGTRWKAIIAESGPTAILPYSYLGTEGSLNGLNAGDPFFNKLGATIGERTFCDSGACTGYIMTVGPTVGLDPESFRHSKYIIIWAANPVSTNSHHWPIITEAPEERREDRGGRSAAQPHRAGGRLAQTRRRHPATAAVGFPDQLGRATPISCCRPRPRPSSSTSCSRGVTCTCR